jgi:hypothetical protein
MNPEIMYTLIGKYVYVMAASYAYAGKLVEVTEEGIKIEDPSIVYDTGPWDAADWADAQKLPTKWVFVGAAQIESAFAVER